LQQQQPTIDHDQARPGLWLKEREWIRGLWPVMYTFVSLTASDVDVDVDVKPGFSLMFDVWC